MPEWLHRKLARQATKKGLTGRSKQAYIYKTLNRVKKTKTSASRRKR